MPHIWTLHEAPEISTRVLEVQPEAVHFQRKAVTRDGRLLHGGLGTDNAQAPEKPGKQDVRESSPTGDGGGHNKTRKRVKTVRLREHTPQEDLPSTETKRGGDNWTTTAHFVKSPKGRLGHSWAERTP